MVIATRAQAVKNAEATKTNVGGTCQLTTRGWFNAPSAGDQDRDGDYDAVDGWESEPEWARHHGDRNPPVGAVLSFVGGRLGYGHRCIAIAPGGLARSTDMSNGRYRKGTVGNATIDQIEHSMGVRYAGWSPTIDGQLIPGFESMAPGAPAKPTPAKPAPKPVKPPAAGSFDVVVATNNVMSLPKNPDITATLTAAITSPTVVGLQELDPVSFKHAAEAIGGWDLTDLPDSVNYAEGVMFDEPVWELRGRRFVKQYDGAAGISYTRHFCVTRLRHKQHGFGAVFISFHAVTKGNDLKRVAMRRAGLSALRRVIKHYRDRGVPIFVMGDYNTRLPQHPTATLKLRHGIDHIYFWNGKTVTGAKKRARTVATRSDHDVFIARITLTLKETR